MVPATPITETIVMGFCHSLLAGTPQGSACCMCTCHLSACTSVGINAIIMSAKKVTLKTAFKFGPGVKSKKHCLQNIFFCMMHVMWIQGYYKTIQNDVFSWRLPLVNI